MSAHAAMHRPLTHYHRIVIKIGSALLVDRHQGLKREWLNRLCEDIAALKAKGVEVMVVSSGAIALDGPFCIRIPVP